MTKSIDKVSFAQSPDHEAKRRDVVLLRFAHAVSLDQSHMVHIYKRGWIGAMAMVDNSARGNLFLHVYTPDTSPVRAYVELVNGREELFDQLTDRLREKFGPQDAEELLSIVQESLDSGRLGRERYVPPEEFTYAALRLDDKWTHDLPLFME